MLYSVHNLIFVGQFSRLFLDLRKSERLSQIAEMHLFPWKHTNFCIFISHELGRRSQRTCVWIATTTTAEGAIQPGQKRKQKSRVVEIQTRSKVCAVKLYTDHSHASVYILQESTLYITLSLHECIISMGIVHQVYRVNRTHTPI